MTDRLNARRPEDDTARRFDLYGALYRFCVLYHSGQWSRGYRLLCLLERVGYRPSRSLQAGRFESEEQSDLFLYFVLKYQDKV